jgi:hypothetical protein
MMQAGSPLFLRFSHSVGQGEVRKNGKIAGNSGKQDFHGLWHWQPAHGSGF